MKVLGIETSCDETAAAVVDGDRILSNVVSSQVELHGRYHGVVPELASRAHMQKIRGVISQALAEAFPGARLGDLAQLVGTVAYTRGPGLAGALLVGKVAAETLAELHGLPLVGVNHLEGHIAAAGFQHELRFPLVALIVSGGHTDLVLALSWGRYRVLGRTRDDAAGEAFDKVAKLLGLGYPGGPAVDALSRRGGRAAVLFPRPRLLDTWDFSFSGLKTAVLYHVQRHGTSEAPDICASFQEAVVETLVFKTMEAAANFRVRSVVVGGGVAANSRLREAFAGASAERGVPVLLPRPSLCTDNGAMIARVAALQGPRRARRKTARRVDPGLPMKSWA